MPWHSELQLKMESQGMHRCLQSAGQKTGEAVQGLCKAAADISLPACPGGASPQHRKPSEIQKKEVEKDKPEEAQEALS